MQVAQTHPSLASPLPSLAHVGAQERRDGGGSAGDGDLKCRWGLLRKASSSSCTNRIKQQSHYLRSNLRPTLLASWKHSRQPGHPGKHAKSPHWLGQQTLRPSERGRRRSAARPAVLPRDFISWQQWPNLAYFSSFTLMIACGSRKQTHR